MFKEERFRQILETLSQDQKVTLKTLSKQLNVSEYTIRRDLKQLTDQGLLKAVRGGAIPNSPTPHHFSDRLTYQSEAKQEIAKKAVTLLQPGQVVVFDGGTTALAIAGILPHELNLTVVTNSFPIVNVLESHPSVDVLFAGGRLHKSAFTAIGHDTLRFFQNIRADIYFMGICSIHPTIGVTTIDYEESEVKKAIVQVSKNVVALTPHQRINTAEVFFICPTSAVHTVITDDEGKESTAELLKDSGISILQQTPFLASRCDYGELDVVNKNRMGMGCTVIFHTGAIASSDHYLTFASAGLPYLGSVSYGVISIPYNT